MSSTYGAEEDKYSYYSIDVVTIEKGTHVVHTADFYVDFDYFEVVGTTNKVYLVP